MSTPPCAGCEAGQGLRVQVMLACGHSFTEHRPPGMVAPAGGELRACGVMEHYPQQYPATYGTHHHEEKTDD